MKTALEQIEELRQFKDGWDEPGDLAPRHDLLDSAVELLKQKSIPRPRIIPTSQGFLCIDWTEGATYYVLRIERVDVGRLMERYAGGTYFHTWTW
jgi:hypothetical protein